MSDFDYDIFISYAHVDDQTVTEEEMGWITLFHLYMHGFLSQNLGEKARI